MAQILTSYVSMTSTQVEEACAKWMRDHGFSITTGTRPSIEPSGTPLHQAVPRLRYVVDCMPVPPPAPSTKPSKKRGRK